MMTGAARLASNCIALVCGAQVGGHFFGSVQVGDGGGEMRLARQKNILGASGQ
jgi:hypothetical protein